jgi:hypothetical protein
MPPSTLINPPARSRAGRGVLRHGEPRDHARGDWPRTGQGRAAAEVLERYLERGAQDPRCPAFACLRGRLGGIGHFSNPESPFGRAFYVAEQSGSAAAEPGHHCAGPTHGFRFSVDDTKAKVLNLTDPGFARPTEMFGARQGSETRALGPAAFQQATTSSAILPFVARERTRRPN